MERLLRLGDNVIAASLISFVGELDYTINHNMQKSTTTYKVKLVVDSETVVISAPSKEIAEIYRDAAIAAMEEFA